MLSVNADSISLILIVSEAPISCIVQYAQNDRSISIGVIQTNAGQIMPPFRSIGQKGGAKFTILKDALLFFPGQAAKAR